MYCGKMSSPPPQMMHKDITQAERPSEGVISVSERAQTSAKNQHLSVDS